MASPHPHLEATVRQEPEPEVAATVMLVVVVAVVVAVTGVVTEEVEEEEEVVVATTSGGICRELQVSALAGDKKEVEGTHKACLKVFRFHFHPQEKKSKKKKSDSENCLYGSSTKIINEKKKKP